MPTPITILDAAAVEAGAGPLLSAGTYYLLIVQINADTRLPLGRSLELGVITDGLAGITLSTQAFVNDPDVTYRIYYGETTRRYDNYNEFPATVFGSGPIVAGSIILGEAGTIADGSVTDVITDFDSDTAYYLGLFTSEWKLASTFLGWAESFLDVLSGYRDFIESLNLLYDIDTATGNQLNVLGQLIGESRTLPFQPTSGSGAVLQATINNAGIGYNPGDVIEIHQGGNTSCHCEIINPYFLLQITVPGTSYTTAAGLTTSNISGSGAGMTVSIIADVSVLSPQLDDTHYRTLLKAKILQNQWDGKPQSLYPAWPALFPGGRIIIYDNADMTADVLIIGAFDEIYSAMITNGLIVPRPQGVLYNYLFPTLPIFGYGLENNYVAGYGVGYWV